LRRSFGLWRDSQYAEFQLAQRQNAELRRAGHAGACNIGSAGGRGKLRQGQLHYALHPDAPNGAWTYNVSFKLKGYHPQSVPVRIAVNESSSMQTGDAGSAPTTVITPDPVVAELEPFAPAA
jgi:hypothetical protein